MAYSKYEWEDIRDRLGAKESGGRSDPYDTVAYDVPTRLGVQNAAGIRPPKPITQMTMGELSDWQETQMRAPSRDYGARRFGPNDPRGKYGSTGVGRYQFERSTLIPTAEREFGKDWRNQPYSPENQERLAKNLWNNVRDNPELARNTWAGVRELDRSDVYAKADDQYTSQKKQDDPELDWDSWKSKIAKILTVTPQFSAFEKALGGAAEREKQMLKIAENKISFRHFREYLREQIISSENKK